jgi:hypothetical protein
MATTFVIPSTVAEQENPLGSRAPPPPPAPPPPDEDPVLDDDDDAPPAPLDDEDDVAVVVVVLLLEAVAVAVPPVPPLVPTGSGVWHPNARSAPAANGAPIRKNRIPCL